MMPIRPRTSSRPRFWLWMAVLAALAGDVDIDSRMKPIWTSSSRWPWPNPRRRRLRNSGRYRDALRRHRDRRHDHSLRHRQWAGRPCGRGTLRHHRAGRDYRPHRRVLSRTRPCPPCSWHRRRLVRTGGSPPTVAHLRLHHHHSQARLAAHRPVRPSRGRAPGAPGFRHRRQRRGPGRVSVGRRKPDRRAGRA